MQNEILKIAKDINFFLKKFMGNQKKTELINPIRYGLFPGGKKIRSKILVDIGYLFNIKYSILIIVGAAIECVHAYSLIHDDLPCMDDDDFRRGRPTNHKVFGEAMAVLAGNSLLTMAFEILSSNYLKLNDKIKNNLINKISKYSGHLGVAGGQFLDLSYEHKKVSKQKIIEMQVKKTGRLFSFCCIAPLIIKNKTSKEIRIFEKIGEDIGLLFQVVDDLIDYKGSSLIAGKKTKKDKKLGKANLISLLGYKNTIKYIQNKKFEIKNALNKYGSKSAHISNTLDYIINRNK